MDSRLSSGEWRLDVGRATLGECHMRLSLKHYTFPRTLKKNTGNIGLKSCLDLG